MLKHVAFPLIKDLTGPLVFSAEFPNRSFVLTGLSADFNALSNATGSDEYADYLGGTNAMKLVGDGLGANEVVNAITPNTIVYDAINMIRVKLKDVLKTAAKRWVRITTANLDDAGSISFNITDVAVGETGAMYSDASIVALANDWVQLEVKFTTGGPDFTGNCRVDMADADNDGNIDNSGAGNELGIHELIITTVK